MTAHLHHVELVVPASAGYVEPVRLTAASLAAELGMDVEEVDDIRIAVHELFVLLLPGAQQPMTASAETADHDPERIELRFELLHDAACIRVHGRRVDAGPHGLADIDEITRAIVSAATDHWELSLVGGAAFQLEKFHVPH